MAEPQIAPYGSWRSPITADLIVAETIRLGQIVLDGEDTYWIEGRPAEGGRNVLVRRASNGQVSDVTPPGFNVRSRVHEYGGGAYAVADGVVYFANFADQRLYRQDPGAPPRPITPDPATTTGHAAALRYADGVIDRARGRLICVHEDHTAGGEAITTLAAVDLTGERAPQVLVSGNDFYAAPCLSPDGARLAWLAWNHPNMPWDGTELWVGQIQPDGAIGAARLVAGGPDESIFQPEWSPDGELHFVSDRSGWWNLYRLRDGQVQALHPMDAEFGLPLWQFGTRTYGFEFAGKIICTYGEQGLTRLASLDTTTGEFTLIETPYTALWSLAVAPGQAVFIGGAPAVPLAIIRLDLATGQHTILRSSGAPPIDAGYLSIPQPIEFPTEDGLTAHAFFYPPRNRDFVAPLGRRPPLLVTSHGGPTGATAAILDLQTQYWTSRGIAVLDVNYGGSTGYGRAYRERLNGKWGIVDVDDCANGARYLARRGEVDGKRLAIQGGSAGGYTTLCALTFRDVFQAGASHFGVSDLEALAKETHKFESRYLDRLIGPYPERRDLYVERSPIYHAGRLECPVIFFQGLEDVVVPPNQAEMMVAALRSKGVPVAYVPFEGEQHGFRRAENIKRALDGELYFYQKYLLELPVELPDWIQDFPSQ